MALTIRERSGENWRTVTLVPATLTRDVWSTMLHGKTSQELSDGELAVGSTVYVHPADVAHGTHLYKTTEELPNAADFVYDETGMRYRIRHSAWDALRFEATQ